MAKEITFDVGNEQVVIRAAMASESKRKALVHALSDSEFLVTQHSSLWRALRALTDRGLQYQPATLRQLLAVEGQPIDDVYIAELERDAHLSANLDWHVATMRWDATRARVLREALPVFVKLLEDGRSPADDVLGASRGLVRSLEGATGRRHIHRGDELSRAYKADLRTRIGGVNVWPSGLCDAFDSKLTEGLMPRRMMVVTGLPGSGKSTWVIRLALSLATRGRRVLMCAWEMPGFSTLDVMVCQLLGLNLKSYMHGQLTDADLVRADKAVDWICRRIKFMENAFFAKVLQQGKRSNDRNLDVLEGYIAESGCDEVILDLWERCLVDLSPDAVTLALERQQQMAKEYGFHCVIVQQLRSKDVEKRNDKRPTRESIKGTGAYTELPDLIFGIHRDAQFKAVPDDSIEAICLKQRKGELNWAVRFDWDGATCAVRNGVEVAYDPGLDSGTELGEVTDISKIRVVPPRERARPGRRDD